MASILKILQIVINDIEDTIYFARIYLEQQIAEEKQIMEIDARPSDCITLASSRQRPSFAEKDVLKKPLLLKRRPLL